MFPSHRFRYSQWQIESTKGKANIVLANILSGKAVRRARYECQDITGRAGNFVRDGGVVDRFVHARDSTIRLLLWMIHMLRLHRGGINVIHGRKE